MPSTVLPESQKCVLSCGTACSIVSMVLVCLLIFFNVGKLQAVSKHRGNPHCKFRSLGQRQGRQSKYLPGQEDELCMGDQHVMAECT